MKRFLITLQFLTILPINIKSAVKPEDLGKSLVAFPIVGMLIGILLVMVSFLSIYLPHLLTSTFILLTSIIVTGGIHLDGFADTCDGFYGSKPKEKILEIMRDSRIGVMGVIGIVGLLLLKFTLIASIPQDFLWKSLIMMTTFSRWAQTVACYTSKYARKDGKAKFFIEYAKLKNIVIGGLFTFVLFLLTAKLKGMVIFILAFLSILLFIQYIKRKIGGMTGDTIGATSETAEVIVLFFTLCIMVSGLTNLTYYK